MILRINVKKATLNGSAGICGQGSTIDNLSNLGVKITVDGEVIALSTNAAVDFVSAIIPHLVGINGSLFTFGGNIGQGFIKVQIDYKHGYTTFNTVESCKVGIELTRSGYTTYSNIFEVYAYDLGNETSTNSQNPDFDIYLVPDTAITFPYAQFITYRKPFTSIINCYNASSQIDGSFAYYDASDDSLLLGTANGIISNSDEVIVYATNILGTPCTTPSVIVPFKRWFPNYSVAVNCDSCDGDCINTAEGGTATVSVDFQTLSRVFINDTETYVSRHFRIALLLYNSNGALEQSDIHCFEEEFATPLFTTYSWDFIPAESGSYLLKSALGAFEKYIEPPQDSGNTNINHWYKIEITGSGADFVVVGAADNNDGTYFFAIGDTPVWSGNYLVNMDLVQECYKNIIVNSCDWLSVTRGNGITNCSITTIKNKSADNVTVVIQQLTAVDTFTDIQTITLSPFASTTVTLDDGVFNIVAQSTSGDANNTIQLISIPSCKIDNCYNTMLKKVYCACPCGCSEDCEDACKKFYNFNAFNILLFTYRGLANTYLNKINIDVTTPTALSELYSLKEIMDKLLEYCEECDCGCN